VSTRETAEVVHEFVRSFVERDAAALAEVVADDCVIEAVAPSPDGELIKGREAGHSHTRFELEEAVSSEDLATIPWRYRFGRVNPLPACGHGWIGDRTSGTLGPCLP